MFLWLAFVQVRLAINRPARKDEGGGPPPRGEGARPRLRANPPPPPRGGRHPTWPSTTGDLISTYPHGTPGRRKPVDAGRRCNNPGEATWFRSREGHAQRTRRVFHGCFPIARAASRGVSPAHATPESAPPGGRGNDPFAGGVGEGEPASGQSADLAKTFLLALPERLFPSPHPACFSLAIRRRPAYGIFQVRPQGGSDARCPARRRRYHRTRCRF